LNSQNLTLWTLSFQISSASLCRSRFRLCWPIWVQSWLSNSLWEISLSSIYLSTSWCCSSWSESDSWHQISLQQGDLYGFKILNCKARSIELSEQIIWRFTPLNNPHNCEVYDVMVKAIKRSLKRLNCFLDLNLEESKCLLQL
jgi:hypothetical protein